MMANAYRSQSHRKRLPRYKFESSDRSLLQNLVNKYIGILERKAVNQNMLDEKKRTWQIITQKFNTQSIDKRVRDAKQLRKCWENMKWRARREAKQAGMDDGPDGNGLEDVTHPSHLTSSLVGVDDYDMTGSLDDDDDDEMIDYDEYDGEDDYEEEEEVVAPMGTEPILEIGNGSSPPGTNGVMIAPLITPRPDPRLPLPARHPISHPPDDELIGSLVADAWIAEDAPGENDDREGLHLKAEVAELIEPAQETTLWNSTRSSSPARSLGSASASRSTRTPPVIIEVNHDPLPRAPSVSSSVGDAAESLSSRHSIGPLSHGKRPRIEKITNGNGSRSHTPQQRRASPTTSVALVGGDGQCSATEVEREFRSEEEHAKKMELLQAQLDYEKSKVERMRRMMEMSEIEHRARMRMLVRYQQVAEKQKEYWAQNVDLAKNDQDAVPPHLEHVEHF